MTAYTLPDTTIKQSDVVLLGYPLMKNMTAEVRQNDLEIYEEVCIFFNFANSGILKEIVRFSKIKISMAVSHLML